MWCSPLSMPLIRVCAVNDTKPVFQFVQVAFAQARPFCQYDDRAAFGVSSGSDASCAASVICASVTPGAVQT